MSAAVKTFFDDETGSLSYVVSDPDTGACAIIDPVLGMRAATGALSSREADRIRAYVEKNGLTVAWILETHFHIDRLSAANYLRERLGGKIGIGAGVIEMQTLYGRTFFSSDEFTPDGRQFDRLFHDGDVIELGADEIEIMATPGHTPACVSYLVGDMAFVGDALTPCDQSAGRCDLAGGSPDKLFASAQRLLALPEETRVMPAHGDDPALANTAQDTIAAHRASRAELAADAARFVLARRTTDAALPPPPLVAASIQVNLRAGALPPAGADGAVYLRIPVSPL